jgi:hypothetical protein
MTTAAKTIQSQLDTAVDAKTTEILAPYDIRLYQNVTVYVKNEGGGTGNSFADVHVESSPTGETGTWVDLTTLKGALELLCDTLAADGVGIALRASNQSFGFIKVMAQCGVGEDTTASCWVVTNRFGG